MPTVGFDSSIEIETDSIPEVFALIRSLYERKRLAVVFDEFQDVLNLADSYETLALLRSQIQFQGDIPYIFIGSLRKKMDSIFLDHQSPFFKSAIPMTVGPLPHDEFFAFLIRKFESGERKINREMLKKIFDIANEIPGDVQQFCEAIWTVTADGEAIKDNIIIKALELIFAREQKSYENYLNLLTDIQQKCLRTIAKEGGYNIFSVAFMKSAGFNNPSSVRRAVTRLINLNILFDFDGEFRFVNPFFRAWLLQRI